MEKQLVELRRQLQSKVRAERRLIQEFEATLLNADTKLHAEIERVQASHLERRKAMLASLVGLAHSIGTMPDGHLTSDGGPAIDHNPTPRRIAQEIDEPESVQQITAFTRDLRES